MKPMSEMTHYEVLELSFGASTEEVDRAYRLARNAFAEDSLASYAALPPEEADAVRERVELAYRILCDPETRGRYDTTLEGAVAEPAKDPLFDFEIEDDKPAPPEVMPEIAGFDDFEEDDGNMDGARLRRARLRHGLEIDRIAQTTKINPTYLRKIESDDFDGLPAAVYVRGFVTAFARSVGLDPERIVPGYMERVAAHREPGQTRRPARPDNLGHAGRSRSFGHR